MRLARLAAGGAFTYKLFVTAVIISSASVRVASTKPDLNISKVAFRLDDGHVVIKLIPSNPCRWIRDGGEKGREEKGEHGNKLQSAGRGSLAAVGT